MRRKRETSDTNRQTRERIAADIARFQASGGKIDSRLVGETSHGFEYGMQMVNGRNVMKVKK